MRALAAVLAVSLCACTVGPDFKPPQANAPADWHAMQRTANESNGASTPTAESNPDPQWWRSFGDATLDTLIARALSGNPDLRIAVVRIAEAREHTQQAAAQGLPNVRASASYKREQLGAKGILESAGVYNKVDALGAPNSPIDQIAPGAGPKVERGAQSVLDQLTAPVNLWQAGFDASWELDLFGRVRRSVEAANAQAEAALESQRDAQVSLEAEVAETYLQLRGAQMLHATAQNLVAEQRETEALARSAATHGLQSELDVARADAERTQTEALLPQYDQQIAQSLNALAVLVGEAPGALDAELTPPAALPGTPPAVPVGLPATLARRRPDIRGAEASLHAATANVGVAVAQFYPDISLTGQIGTRATSPHDLAHWASLFWSWGPSVSLPVFQGGALVSNLRLSKLQQVEAALDYRKTVLGALRDVNNALDVYRTDQARLLSLDESAAAQRRAFDLARDSYRKGIVSFIDVLDAQRQLSSAEQNAQQAQLQVCTDLVALYKALGGGWEQAGPIASSASSQAP
ncbi:efflux transporter outer membrane subunit [Paraburkholderia silvatlantica]|uniref:NodT family efflux transporter outer membrane factor (OMF) lipoprotein n=1 Tax=Paraburkholderia silvatlantica TaxID=321895 RepID=A0A2U1AIP2_9BURK|nr:efflux transporter outer membrane subunit [Paraburkholderia silvatlantica]MBB2927588.1 NodT family efflux transporter outer membrane factor (OMF) lipoprotein [Paraburkholderia silvatlantica]PVY36299.1 NodT family efflux transporter outer membrane factor (OMF) lipoprotein [Paraburkholderia silvatlantica]PXW40284.1 NodT family efflux transporter outer membrane factor (OMF) lipoprotein [Paraburkholderia silvatlantica]PYE24244.1 NodT family efflux transporter outer membrane factor (OMF) lipoprot